MRVTRDYDDSIEVQVFAQCLFDGEINLYEYISPAKLRSRFFADSPDYGITEVLVKLKEGANGLTVFYSDEMHELFRNLQRLFWRCERVSMQVPSTKNMSRKKLITLFEAYHLCVDKPYEVIGYRKANTGRIHVGIKGGTNLVLNAKSLLGLTGRSAGKLRTTAQPQIAAFLEYPFPNLDNKFSVAGELGITKHFWYQDLNGNTNAYQVQYVHASALGQRNSFFNWGKVYSNIGIDIPLNVSTPGPRTIDSQTVNFIQPPPFNLFLGGGMGFQVGNIGILLLETRVHLTNWQYIRFQTGFRF